MAKIQITDPLGSKDDGGDGSKKMTIVIQGKGVFKQLESLTSDTDGNLIITVQGHGVGNGVLADGGQIAAGKIQVTYDGPGAGNIFEGDGEVHVVGR